MSYQSDNLNLEVLENGDPADLSTVSDNFDKIDAVAGDIATVETSPTKAAHSVGEFLLYEGRLYKVTSAISVGGSLILGTNVQAANIGSELKSFQDLVNNITYSTDGLGIVGTIDAGGYAMIGKLVIVNLRFTRTDNTPANTNLVSGLPKPKYTSPNYIAGCCSLLDTPVYISYDTNRTVIRSTAQVTGGVSYVVSFFYIAA